MRTLGSVIAALSLALLAAVPAQAQVPVLTDPQAVGPGAANPLAGQPLFVDAFEPSWRHWRSLRNRGKTGSAARMWTIARQPKFRWLGGDHEASSNGSPLRPSL